MDSENPYRIALLAVFGTSLPIALYFRIRSSASGERLSRREEGRLMFVSLRLAGVALMLSTLAYLINPAWLGWSSIDLPPACRWAGFGLGAVAIPLVAWTLHSLGQNLTDTVVTRQNHHLVTTGPYRYVRHPYYVATFLLILGAGLLTANLLIGLAGLTVCTLLALRTPNEERRLVDRFGDDYRTYMSQTGRYLPRLR